MMTITHEPHPSGYRILIDGEPCGPRLVKGGHFPLQRERWWIVSTEAEALAAGVRLKGYLETQFEDQLKAKKEKE